MSLRRRTAIAWSIIAAGVGLVFATCQAPPADAHLNIGRPECPHSWREIQITKREGDPGQLKRFDDGFSVSRSITDVPEYHDCQKFVVATEAGPQFTPQLFAIFAAENLDSVVQLSKPTDTLPQSTTVLAAAEILNYHPTRWYGKLGIGPYFNCLYVWGSTTAPKALMVHVGENEPACGGQADRDTLSGMPLHVRIAATAGDFNRPSDVPAVARWDYDPTTDAQYIGLACGPAWCEIGPPGFAPSPVLFDATAALQGGASVEESDRVRAIKGWYDQQYLAVPDAPGTGVVASRVLGTVIPASDLGSLQTTAPFESIWRTVAYMAISADSPEYAKKFGLAQVAETADLKDLNTLSFCLGRHGACIPSNASVHLVRSCSTVPYLKPWLATRLFKTWWLRVQPPGDGKPKYMCVKQRTHPDIASKYDVPSTTRWRWLSTDDTNWVECLNGCCESLACDDC